MFRFYFQLLRQMRGHSDCCQGNDESTKQKVLSSTENGGQAFHPHHLQPDCLRKQ